LGETHIVATISTHRIHILESNRTIFTNFKMKFATLLTISTTAYGLAFDGPLPTPVTDLVYAALTGFSPKPTNEVRALPDLFRRQKNANQSICGFLNGDAGTLSASFHLAATLSRSCHTQPPTIKATTQPFHLRRPLPTPTKCLLHPFRHTQLKFACTAYANKSPCRLPCVLHIQLLMHLLGLTKLVRLLRLGQLRSNDALHKQRLAIKLPRRRVLL
jgi:hypothetical protein